MFGVQFKTSSTRKIKFGIFLEDLSTEAKVRTFSVYLLNRLYCWTQEKTYRKNKPLRLGIIFSNLSIFSYFISEVFFMNYPWLDWENIDSRVLFCNGSWRDSQEISHEAVKYMLRYQYDPMFTPVQDLYCDVHVLKVTRCLRMFKKLKWFSVTEKFIRVNFSQPLSYKGVTSMDFKMLKDEHPTEAVRRMSLSGEPKLW